MNTARVVKTAFLLSGLTMLTLAVYHFVPAYHFKSRAQETEGVVVTLHATHSGKSTIYWPMIEFRTRDSRVVRFRSLSGSNPPSYEVGERVRVLYDESAPDKARIDSFMSMWSLVLILGGLGCVFFFIGFGLFLSQRAGSRKGMVS